MPIPRIYAYSSDPLNPVGAEYIIEERQKENHWGLVEIETKLTSISFWKHGCIYYRKDLEERKVKSYDLDAKSLSSGDFLKGNPLEEFAFGPLTEARLWGGEKAAMKLDRGPWSTPLSYLAAIGINEILWTESYAKPRINPYRSLERLETPVEYISLLERYLKLVPLLSPGPVPTSLSHPDLHLDNVFVNPDTKQITCIIDWQSVSVSEPFFQEKVPRLLLPVQSNVPDKPVKATREGSRATDSANRTALLLSHYQELTRVDNKQRCASMALQNRSYLTKPSSILCGAWDRNDVISFRHALIHIAAQCKDIAPADVSCPIQFTEEELQLHHDEMELVEGLGEVLHQLQDDNLIPLGGMVLREYYEQALHINNSVKEMFLDMADSESQRNLYSRIWPYQD
ncbi:uncharacterized protein K460DRAFT_410935 [Cucurbitaria berberidis CBS 394.84]|uniref:Aminoglycoside phosphotransferase domain-containing protein n=1 Tax=Cucurbitaria berberidis CBS 394.84 TaxID=1168544 RepID=A0A9P4G7H2_9PLEO|nr:uncharacterized protein K460DRAFT_410935 [Cucurbitaria berberidis CBS 394.84]KAF1840342.1 hypothetical protein K460DRAFT_410935 [Cucurbitaria berberidis CBS 394.84]